MRLINADALEKKLHELALDEWNQKAFTSWSNALLECEDMVYNAQTVDAVEIVHCKDCIHKPTGRGVNHDITFPEQDYRCPCRCEDYWYSWMPDDDWFCANGERIKNE